MQLHVAGDGSGKENISYATHCGYCNVCIGRQSLSLRGHGKTS